MTTPSADQIAKLPKWAQEHITNIVREREVALNALNTYVDNQTPAPFYIDELECLGEQAGPSCKRRYVNTRHIAVQHVGVQLNVYLRGGDKGDGRDAGIEIQWGVEGRTGEHVAFVPTSFQQATIIPHDRMYVHPKRAAK